MPCPVAGCGGQITFNTYQLLQGKKFSCPNCDATIGLSNESNDVVHDTISQFEDMRERLKSNESQ